MALAPQPASLQRVLACALAVGLVAAAPWIRGGLGLAGAAAASAIAYPALLLLCRAIGREDVALVRSCMSATPALAEPIPNPRAS